MSDEKSPPSLEELEARLKKARDAQRPKDAGPGKYHRVPQGSLAAGFRVGSELLAAMIVGVGGGLLLDRWLGSAPWGLVIMFFIGAAAGVLNVYRAVNGLGMATGYRRSDEDDNGRPSGGAH